MQHFSSNLVVDGATDLILPLVFPHHLELHKCFSFVCDVKSKHLYDMNFALLKGFNHICFQVLPNWITESASITVSLCFCRFTIFSSFHLAILHRLLSMCVSLQLSLEEKTEQFDLKALLRWRRLSDELQNSKEELQILRCVSLYRNTFLEGN